MNSRKSNTLILMDIGNSRIKLLHKNKSVSIEYSKNWCVKVEKAVENFGCSSKAQIIAISVNKEQQTELSKLISIHIIESEHIRKNASVSFKDIQGIGIDRMMGLIYAHSKSNGSLTITIDCGTATTINVAHKNKCLGGQIIPGIGTQAKSLSQNTSLLPLVKPKAIRTLLGKDTSSAINAGIVYSTALTAIGVIKELEKKYKKKAEVFLTGGNATIIKNILQKEIPLLLEPNLVIKGVQKYAEENILSIK